MSPQQLTTPLGESDVLKQLDTQARRVHNRGLADFLEKKVCEYQGNEFRPEDLRHLVKERYPAADAGAIGNALAQLARERRGVERVGIRSGVYRVGGSGPHLEDEAVLDQAMQALAALEVMIKRHREVLTLTRTLKKALGAL